MSDEKNINTIVEDLNGISAEIFSLRNDIREMSFENHQKDALKSVDYCNNEVIMIIDDMIAIMVDELGAKFDSDI